MIFALEEEKSVDGESSEEPFDEYEDQYDAHQILSHALRKLNVGNSVKK